jgi:copper chaperone NosL
MNKNILVTLFALLLLPLLNGCSDEKTSTEIPGPIAMTEEAVGHYCNMNILEHTGPKAQIHLKNILFPVWFSQVRDAIAFMRLPEETQEPVAIYVNDMGKATDWDFPSDDTWIEITSAFFVIESNRNGSMGAPEAVPFGTREGAKIFVGKYGGKIARIDEIPDAYVLGPVDISTLKSAAAGVVK